jgi:tetratricopeptide (TPR) repeat protein
MQDSISAGMIQMKKLPICLLLMLLASSVSGQVSVENARDYLESGELSYTIDINFSRINWKTEAEYRREMDKAEKVWRQHPESSAMLVQYLGACEAAGRRDLAAETAGNHFQMLQEEYKERRDETSARRLLIAANLTGSRELQISAYETVRPFLELGNAEAATVAAALDNRELLGDYHLGFRIAEFYQKIYPYEAEIFFRGFLMTLNNSLYRTIPFMVNAIHQQMEGLEEFLREYFRNVADSIYLDLLDTAAELEPDNYQYLLSSVGFRALVRWFTQMSTLMVEEEADFTGIQDVFNSLRLEEDETLRNDLEKALAVRPEADHQVFLAAALYQTTLGDTERAREYVEKALQIRPDLPEGYNARIFLEMFSFAGEETAPTAEQRGRIANILNEKMKHAGEHAYDLFVLSALQLLTLRDGIGGAGREQALSEMESYARKSLEVEENAPARLSLGNALLLRGEVKEAVEQYTLARQLSSEDFLYASTANLGVAYMIMGNPAEGKEMIQKAEELAGDTVRASALIENR